MNPRAIFTVSVTAGLFSLYIAYALVMNTIIGVQTLEAVRTHKIPPPKPPAESREIAQRYLVQNDSDLWVLDSRFQVRSHGSYIFYEDWEHKKWDDSTDRENAVEFSPLGLVMTQAGKQPFTIVSESARVKFARPFSIRNPDTGRPVAVVLQGRVRITGPDGLVIVGRDFSYSEESKSIWSDRPVTFRQGRHSGKADRGIQIDLEIDPAAVARDEMAIAGIRNLKLSKNITLNLVPEKQENVENIIVRCDGTLDFDTQTNVATFRNNVRVSAPTGERTTDSLSCDTLKLVFLESAEPRSFEVAKMTGEKEPEPDARKPIEGLKANLAFERLEAASEGNPVIFRSETNQLEATMNRFLYNASNRVAVLSHPNQVLVTQRQTQMAAPEITLVHDEPGELQSAVCRGAGRLQHLDDESGQLILDTRWQRELRLHPEADSGLYLIELDRQAIVRQPAEQFGLQADYIKLWVRQLEKQNDVVPSSPPSAKDKWKGGDVLPEKMLAIEHVRFSNPDLRGSTRRLEIWFEHRPEQIHAVSHVGSSSTSGIHQASYLNGGGGLLGRDKSDKSRLPADLSAELIQIQVLSGNDLEEAWVKRIVTTGKVRVTQPQKNGELPLVMDGERIDIENRDPGNRNQIVHVFGKPARIHDRETQLAGNQLHLDRASNRAWVSGPGMMQFLVDSKLESKDLPLLVESVARESQEKVDSNLESEDLSQPEPVTIWWKEKMNFDGLTATFYDSVRTEMQQSNFLCQEMSVTLSRKIDFLQDDQPTRSEREKIDIEKLHCKYGVEFESREFEEGKLKEVRQGQFGELVFDNATGKTLATGPGTLSRWDLGASLTAESGGNQQAYSNRPVHTSESEWKFMQVDFSGNVDGNANSHLSTFRDGIQVVYGPVEKPGDTVDPEQLGKSSGWMRSELLDIAYHPKTESQAGWVELVASGNVELEGAEFHALSDTVTFDESKKMYKIRSLGNRMSQIWRQKKAGAEAAPQAAQAFTFWPDDNKLNVENATIFSAFE